MKTRMMGLILLVALLVLSGTVLAATASRALGEAGAVAPMRLDWYVLTGSGGGEATSSHYQLDFTVGQTVVGAASSTNYGLGLGYWAGIVSAAPPGPTFDLYLPIVLRNF